MGKSLDLKNWFINLQFPISIIYEATHSVLLFLRDRNWTEYYCKNSKIPGSTQKIILSAKKEEGFMPQKNVSFIPGVMNFFYRFQ